MERRYLNPLLFTLHSNYFHLVELLEPESSLFLEVVGLLSEGNLISVQMPCPPRMPRRGNLELGEIPSNRLHTNAGVHVCSAHL